MIPIFLDKFYFRCIEIYSWRYQSITFQYDYFKHYQALPISNTETKDTPLGLLEEIIKRGFIFAPSVVSNYSEAELKQLITTDAPEPLGAFELFYIKKQEEADYVLIVNYYNYSEDEPVSFKILVAQDIIENFDNKYLVDPNKILAISKSNLDVRQQILGIASIRKDYYRFYFNKSNLGMSISSSTNEYTEQARKYLLYSCEHNVMLNDYFSRAGAIIVPQFDERIDIDLSPEKIQKDTILKLIV